MTESFQLFGTVHLWTIFVLVVIGVALIFPTRKFATEKQKIMIGASIGIFMIIQEFVDRGYHIFIEKSPIQNNLPFHLCGISVFLVAILLINRNYKLFEISYFWGLSGALVSILTPDVGYTFPHLLNITFFLSHALIFIGVLYMIFIFDYRPTLISARKSFFILHAYALIIGILNYIINTNYLFLCHKPESETPLDFMGPWPWYIISLEIAVILFWVILYSPYFIKDLLNKNN